MEQLDVRDGKQLDQQVAVVTGGTGDIGRATALRLAGMGARVTLLDVLPSTEGEQVARELGGGITYLRCDVTRRDDVEAAFATLPRVDVAVVNAGIVRAGSFLDLSVRDWTDTIDVNLSGAFHTAQVAARRMVTQAPDAAGVRGRIMFTGSWVQDMPHPGTFAYISSKGGLKMLTKCMAQELAEWGILVNLVAPGAVKAGLTKQLYDRDENFRKDILAAVPLGAFQSAENVAGSFAFLCTEDANYMTGATMLIDGGLSLVRYPKR